MEVNEEFKKRGMFGRDLIEKTKYDQMFVSVHKNKQNGTF